jgi:energy-coupling factor transporter ATP-binding protein EcfA2
MKRVALERVVAAAESLRKTKLKRAGALLPGFFALKREGLVENAWTKIPPSAFSNLATDLFGVADPPDPDRPFFHPLLGEWRADNWPLGSIQTRFVKLSTPLTKSDKLGVRGSGQNYEWRLEPGYEATLSDYVDAAARIPYNDFVAWVFRARHLDDDRSLDDLKKAVRAEFKLTDEEFDQLFVDGGPEDDDDFFDDEDWDLEALTARLPSPEDTSQDEDDEESGALPPLAPPPGDAELVAEILRYMRETAKFEVDEELVRNVLSSLRTDRFATLVGKTGTGKTEFVKAFAAGLERALAGTGVKVHLVDIEIGEETAEHDIIGYRSIEGKYVPSNVIDRLNRGDPDRDIYIVLLDEMNLAPVDTYAGKLVASIENNLEIDLPGHDETGGAATTSWLSPRGACIIGTMNSYLEDPTRKMLSRPITRRTQPIEMPDVFENLVRQAASDEPAARDAFETTCRLLLDQRAERLQTIGVSALDGDRIAQLRGAAPADVVDVLWAVGKVLAGRPDVAMTLGPLQDALEYVQTSVFDDNTVALDLQIAQKIMPMLRGDAALIDEFEKCLPAEFTRSRAALAALRGLAEANQRRIKPRF